ncbi:hypothetical protein [Pseudomonas sp. Z3-8]|uniref:hypothetical protein n=1 Tax=Pseudomonas sp. Z3-8 TaxID=2817412 RepID=UPI003DA8500A
MIRSEKRLGAAILCLLAACALLFFFPPDSVVENPGDLTDTRGVPAVSIYLVLLIILASASLALTGIGSIAQRFLRRRSFRLRISVYVLANIPLVLTSLLGGLVSLAYLYDAVSGLIAALLFLLAFAFVLLAIPPKPQ